jgi:hypothetical protein
MFLKNAHAIKFPLRDYSFLINKDRAYSIGTPLVIMLTVGSIYITMSTINPKKSFSIRVTQDPV